MKTLSKKAKAAALKHGWRSGLEERVAAQLDRMECRYAYEEVKLDYTMPVSKHTYLPDFILENGIVVETKGRFMPADRKKHLLVKAQYPDLDIRFTFSNSKQPICKGSKTSYASWCLANSFQYSDKLIPEEWMREERGKSYDIIKHIIASRRVRKGT